MSPRVTVLLAAVICGGWGYLIYQSWLMNHAPMTQMWMPPARLADWEAGDFFWVFSMWAVMMAAMMLPSALPMLAAFSRYCRKDAAQGDSRTLWFAGGYLAVWVVFSVVLTLIQWLLHGLAWLSPMMDVRQPLLTALILLIAGTYQFSSFKYACLRQCRTPFGYLLNQWRPGIGGALQIGFRHGLSCLGCCWAHMLLMFAIGVMNVSSMLLVTVLVIVEKWTPGDAKKLSHGIGVLLIILAGFSVLSTMN